FRRLAVAHGRLRAVCPFVHPDSGARHSVPGRSDLREPVLAAAAHEINPHCERGASIADLAAEGTLYPDTAHRLLLRAPQAADPADQRDKRAPFHSLYRPGKAERKSLVIRARRNGRGVDFQALPKIPRISSG